MCIYTYIYVHVYMYVHQTSTQILCPLYMCMCVCVYTCLYVHAKSFHSCPTLCNPMDCSLPGSSIHGVLEARILEWVAMPSLLQGLIPTQGSNLHWKQGSLPLVSPGKAHTHTVCMCVYTCACMLNCVRLFVTPMNCSLPGSPVMEFTR